jgi:GNAT superfamily N-acetyltransferase
MDFITELLQADHKRSAFSCGEESLDAFIQKQASQHLKSRAAGIFVALDEDKRVKGYYTLSSDNIPYDEVPEDVRKKMPRYQSLPTTLLGRLAVDLQDQGAGFGELLLLDALYRVYTLSVQIGSIAVVVDALHEKAATFYEQYGFIRLPDRGRLFIPMKSIGQLFESK